MTRPEDHDLHALFAAARAAVPSRETIDAALERTSHQPPAPSPSPASNARQRRTSRPLRHVAIVSVALTLILGGLGYAAAPPIRAAIDDASGTFAGWLGSDTAPAGRPATAAELPDYMRESDLASRARVVAEAGGYPLTAVRRTSGTIDFDLGNTGAGLGFSPDTLLDHDVRVLGPGAMSTADRHGHVPLFGVTSRRVATVELENRDGTTSQRSTVAGAFVLLAEPTRQPVAVVGRDRSGATIERVVVNQTTRDCPCIDWTEYSKR